MEKKKQKKFGILLRFILIFDFIVWDAQLLKWYLELYPIISNPYHNLKIDMNQLSLENQENFINQYIEDLSEYQLFEHAEKIQKDMLENLKLVCLSNPYIDYSDLADRVASTTVEYKEDRGQHVSGKTYNYTFFLSSAPIKQEVFIYGLNKKNNWFIQPTYFHELIHALFPPIKDSNFFEEALTDIITNECSDDRSIGYPLHRALGKMWIETLGVDIFKEMRATGNIDPFKDVLLHLGYSKNDVTNFIKRMNEFHWLYMMQFDPSSAAEKLEGNYPQIYNEDQTINEKVLKTFVKTKMNQLIDDVEDVFQKQYQQDPAYNIIMSAYKSQLLSDDNPQITYIYYDTYYFTDQEVEYPHIWWVDGDTHCQYSLTSDDFNLIDEKPKTLIK